MINKEFRCRDCGDFVSGIAICPKCGEIGLRVFNTPPGIGSGRARRIDAVLTGEFARRNISNYTNANGRPVVNYGSGEYNGIRAGWGKQQLGQIQQQYAPGASVPMTVQGNPLPLQATGEPKQIGEKNSEAWSKAVPTERMDLTPNE